MTWPVSTTVKHLDSNFDNPRWGRTEIKSNVEAVNSIISTFGTVDLSSVQSGQMFGYQSSTGKWIGIDNNLQKGAYVRATIQSTSNSYSTTTGSASVSKDFTFEPDGKVDNNNYVFPAGPQSSTDNPEIPAGTYAIKITGFVGFSLDRTPNVGDGTVQGYELVFNLIDTDSSTTLATFTPVDLGSYSRDWHADTDEHDEVLWASLACTRTFSSATNIKLTATLNITIGGLSTTGEGTVDFGCHVLTRFIKIT